MDIQELFVLDLTGKGKEGKSPLSFINVLLQLPISQGHN